jgi:hypothetical protein
MQSLNLGSLTQSGREITSADLMHAREVVEMFPGLSRVELARTLCEHWCWETASGTYKVEACLKLLEKLEGEGLLRLPEKGRGKRGPRVQPVIVTDRTDPPALEIHGKLSKIGPIRLVMASSAHDKGLWNEYMERYHYLGHKKPFGFRRRYFVESEQGPLGCVLLAGAAKALGVRDRWIGWSETQRLKNLPWVANNTRFVLFPWVRVKLLASHVLGQLARRVRDDWEEAWGFRPVLLETFVDPGKYSGVSYRAAGWRLLGKTTGRGLARPGQSYHTTPKAIYVRPLAPDFREQLCSETLKGMREED